MSELSTVEVLREARKLIEDPERWGQGANAYDPEGNEVDYATPEACQFCAVGALLRVAGDGELFLLAEGKLATVTDVRGYFFEFNDAHSHAEVLDAFDKAIAEAERSA